MTQPRIQFYPAGVFYLWPSVSFMGKSANNRLNRVFMGVLGWTLSINW